VVALVSPLTSWTFDPIQLTSLALIGFLYFRRAHTLEERELPVEAWRRWSFGSGLAMLFVVLASPVDALGEKQFLFVHMIQHIVIGDLAPLLMVAGLTGPIPRPMRSACRMASVTNRFPSATASGSSEPRAM